MRPDENSGVRVTTYTIALAQRNQQEYLLLINLVSKYAKQDDKKPEEAAPPAPERAPEDHGENRI